MQLQLHHYFGFAKGHKVGLSPATAKSGPVVLLAGSLAVAAGNDYPTARIYKDSISFLINLPLTIPSGQRKQVLEPLSENLNQSILPVAAVITAAKLADIIVVRLNFYFLRFA